MYSLKNKKPQYKHLTSPNVLLLKDTAGQERFHALGPIYYRDADAALLVYDITDMDSFIRVRKWVKELQQMASKPIVMAIAANKSDLVRENKFDLHEAESYASSIGAGFFVTSAKFGTGVDEIFLHIATRVLQLKKEGGDLSPIPQRKAIIVVENEPQKELQPKCCT
ncbi:uncharacterized protein LOC144715627 isoform X4 [Wolffia australiana]